MCNSPSILGQNFLSISQFHSLNSNLELHWISLQLLITILIDSTQHLGDIITIFLFRPMLMLSSMEELSRKPLLLLPVSTNKTMADPLSTLAVLLPNKPIKVQLLLVAIPSLMRLLLSWMLLHLTVLALSLPMHTSMPLWMELKIPR